MAKATISTDTMSGNTRVSIELERQFDAREQGSILREAMKEAAKTIAQEWIEKNRDNIFGRLNVDAIANMIMVEVANDIKNDVREKK